MSDHTRNERDHPAKEKSHGVFLGPGSADCGEIKADSHESQRSSTDQKRPAHANQTASAATAARKGAQRQRTISCRHVKAYAAKQPAPASMARASSEANDLPLCDTVRASVASATEGAAPKIPANVFGFSMSASEAKRQTTKPPIRKRIRKGIAGSRPRPRNPGPQACGSRLNASIASAIRLIHQSSAVRPLR